jgi:hypothetical protein
LCRSVSDRHRLRGTDAIANPNSAFRAFGVSDAERNAADRTDGHADASFGAERLIDASYRADGHSNPNAGRRSR